MDTIDIQEILPFVETPSRYLGSEANSIVKPWDQVDLTFALAFPDLYEIGTSHFGMQILYTLLNRQETIVAERFFTPAPDMETLLQERKIPLFSLESKQSLQAFDIIGFSLLYELNFTNILTMLHLGNIPFYAKEREESDISYPLIVGGGPCTFNPEPLADFFDAFVIGDGEEAVLELSEVVRQWKTGKQPPHSNDSRHSTGLPIERKNKNDLLEALSKIQGVYIPSFFNATYRPLSPASHQGDETESGTSSNETVQVLAPLLPGYDRVKRAILPDLEKEDFPTSPVVPFGKPVHDRLRLEVARGCSRGCRFCQAGMIYRPVRERSVDGLLSIAKTSLKETGYSDISLLSLSTGDYSGLTPLMKQLLSINPGHCTAISLPSVRADKLTAPLMEIIESVKKTGFTIAPEAGTQRLRDVINKNITEEDIFNTVNSAFDLGWRTIKLYFMNGLPTETQEDLEGIVELTKRLITSQNRRKGEKEPTPSKKKAKGRLNINVSFATFIPKAHTPFQRCAQIPPEQSLENLNFLKKALHHPGIQLKWQNPWMSLLEGVWARGDRRLSAVLVSAWKKGCRLDGWSDKFRIDLWQEAFEENGIDPLFYTARERGPEEPLPWDHIDCGISKRFFEKEYDNALEGHITQDCRDHDCTGCGICDFKTVKPHLFPSTEMASEASKKTAIPDSQFLKLTLFYSRMGDARHFGHLELAKVIRRAIRRTGITVKYSKGFNPTMKIAFDNPLPVGMQSQEEFFHIHAHIGTDIQALLRELNQVLPRSITITRCLPTAKVKHILSAAAKEGNPTRYLVDLKTHPLSQKEIDDFMTLTQYLVDQVTHKGVKRQTDLRKMTRSICIPAATCPSRIEMVLVKDGERTVRPAEILSEVFDVPDAVLQVCDIIKLKPVSDINI